jgi:hypothetical protein
MALKSSTIEERKKVETYKDERRRFTRPSSSGEKIPLLVAQRLFASS